MTDIVERLRHTASKGISGWGDLQIQAANEIQVLRAERNNQADEIERLRDQLHLAEVVRAAQVEGLPLLKQWPVLYEAAKAGHEQAFAEAQNAAAVSAAKDKEIAQLRAELIKSLADNAALRADAIDRQNNVVAPLRAEVAGLRETLAQKVVDQTMLTGLTVQDGGLTMGLQGGAAGLLVEMLAQQFKDGGGINYLQLSFTSSVCLPGEAFIVTVQKCAGKSPHQLRMDAETEAAALRTEVAGLREDAERYREWKRAFREGECALWNALCEGQSDAEHDAAIDAALAARKGEA